MYIYIYIQKIKIEGNVILPVKSWNHGDNLTVAISVNKARLADKISHPRRQWGDVPPAWGCCDLYTLTHCPQVSYNPPSYIILSYFSLGRQTIDNEEYYISRVRRNYFDMSVGKRVDYVSIIFSPRLRACFLRAFCVPLWSLARKLEPFFAIFNIFSSKDSNETQLRILFMIILETFV